MSQESNTASNSDDKPKKRLSLKKSTGGTPSPAPSTPSRGAASHPEPTDTQKPFRMAFKKKEDETAEAPAADIPRVDEFVEDSPALPDPISPIKLGLKKDQPDNDLSVGSKDASPLVPPFAPPPPFSTDLTEPENKPGLLPPPPPISGAPKPPPGMKIRRDDDNAMPPPLPPLGVTPPMPMVDDLMDEVVEADKKKSDSNNSLKGILIAFVIILILFGGIGFFAWGVVGMLNDKAVTEEPPPAPPTSTAKSDIEPAADKPKGFLGKTALLTEQVSAKASTEEITTLNDPFDQPAPKAAATPPESAAPVETTSTQTTPPADFIGIIRDVPPPPKATRTTGDPEIRAWIENLSPTGIGRGQMLLNGEKYRVGEVINPQLNIRWVGLDQQLGILIFEDPYGVRYEKDY